MNFKNLIKIFNFALLVTHTYGKIDNSGDCKDIFDYFTKKNIVSSITECNVDSKGKVTTLALNSYEITDEGIKKALSYNTITNLQYHKAGATPYHNPEYNKFPPEIANLTNLEELTFGYSGYRTYARSSIESGSLKVSKSLKRLSLGGIEISQSNIDDISTLTNLEKLEMVYMNRPSSAFSFDPLKSLKNLSYIEIKNEAYFQLNDLPDFIYSVYKTLKHLGFSGHGINNISDKLSSLSNLEYLDLSGNEIKSVLKNLVNLTKLTYIDLSRNIIDENLPESLNNLKNLSIINLEENKNISGKTLTNSNLSTCIYDKAYSLCMAKSMKCLEKNDYSFKSCNSNDPVDNSLGISVDGRCGKNYGKCPSGECCSKYGWCGKSDKHCSISEGCQSEFSTCNPDISISIDGRCGKGHGICKSGYCCSKYGWCGTTNDYCSISSGCQEKFGICVKTTEVGNSKNNQNKISVDGKCGPSNSEICPYGQCCSKYGWCGMGDKYCGSGCQKEFGGCY